MPKIKKVNDENKCPVKNQSTKRKHVAYKFDIKKILKEREVQSEYWKKSAELDKQIKVIDDLFEKEVNRVNENNNGYPSDSLQLGYVVFDRLRYNVLFENNINSDTTKTYLQKLFLMSIEENELEANIHFNNLMNANWSPVFDDIQNLFINWGVDVDTLNNNKPLLKCVINNDERRVTEHNFELVLNFLSQCIKKSDNKLSANDLLTLAKFSATLSLDHYYGQMTNVIQNFFCACIETALHDDGDIISFCQELYSKYQTKQLLKMVVCLLLPLEGKIMKKIYTYLTFKLYKTLLGKTNNLNPFPSSIKDWFVQDQVNAFYFSQKPFTILKSVIHLLEHVVIVFDLYENEEKLSTMYDFLYKIVKPSGLSDSSFNLVNILDHWRLHLFRLHVTRKNMLT